MKKKLFFLSTVMVTVSLLTSIAYAECSNIYNVPQDISKLSSTGLPDTKEPTASVTKITGSNVVYYYGSNLLKTDYYRWAKYCTDNPTITLYLKAEDRARSVNEPASGIASMQITYEKSTVQGTYKASGIPSTGRGCDLTQVSLTNGWIDCSETFTTTLPGPGLYNFFFKVKDKAGNVSKTYEDTASIIVIQPGKNYVKVTGVSDNAQFKNSASKSDYVTVALNTKYYTGSGANMPDYNAKYSAFTKKIEYTWSESERAPTSFKDYTQSLDIKKPYNDGKKKFYLFTRTVDVYGNIGPVVKSGPITSSEGVKCYRNCEVCYKDPAECVQEDTSSTNDNNNNNYMPRKFRGFIKIFNKIFNK